MTVTFWRWFWIEFWGGLLQADCCYRCRGPVAYGQWNDGPLAGRRVCWNPKGCKR